MSGTLPNWMEHWFGLSGGSGMGVAWRLEYRWPWPPWATLLGGALLIAAIIGIYLRENRAASRGYRLGLASVRIFAVGLILLMIAQVELSLQRTGLPLVVVIVDDTRSMNTVDHYDQDLRKSLEDRVTRVFSGLKSGNGDGKTAKSIGLSRWNVLRTLVAEDDAALLEALADSHKVRFYFLSKTQEGPQTKISDIVPQLKAAEANGDSTRLGFAIHAALDELRGTTPVAIVLATDGINTEGPGLLDAAAYARRKGVPLLLIGVGSDRPARDLKLSDLEVEDLVFVNDLVHFRFKLTATGFSGKRVSIVLRGEKATGSNSAGLAEVVGRTEVAIAADGRTQEVILPLRPTQPGQFRYKIDVESPPGDQVTRHLPLVRSIRVREEKIRVLLVDGTPRFEYRFLRNLLSRDKTIELRTFLQEADIDASDAEMGETLRVFPVRREDLLAYDVVIFGDVDPSLLSSAAVRNLADSIDRQGRGGALVLVAGENFMPQTYRNTPLARLLPFDPAKARNPKPDKPLKENFVVQPTEMGFANPAMQLGDSLEQSRAIWEKLPPLHWMIELSDLKPLARVLAENPSQTGTDGKRLPVILMQNVGGGGKVLFHATDETFHWRQRGEDLYFARYWIQAIRFLTRSKLAEGDRAVRLTTDRRDYSLGDAIRMRADFSDDRLAPLDDIGVVIELEQTGRQTQKVSLRRVDTGRGQFEAVLVNLPVGSYHAKIVAPSLPGKISTVDFAVAPPQTELANIQMDVAGMTQAALLTKGHYYTCQDASRLIEDLPEGRQVPVESLPSVPLWNRWPVLALLLGLLIVEWLLRKRGGMV
jgi:hypothetical protein